MTLGFMSKTTSLMADGSKRFARARMWVVLQFAGLALLIAFGLLWTRIPEKQAGQVLLTFVLPLLIAAAFLWLQAGTMRSMLGLFDAERADPKRQRALVQSRPDRLAGLYGRRRRRPPALPTG